MKLFTPFLLFFILLSCACTVTVPSPVHVATSTVSVAGSVAVKTTSVAVRTSGYVVASSTKAVVHTTGSIAKSVVTAPFVIIKDTVTGVTRQIPYREGLRLYAASQTGQFEMALKGFELFRNGTPVMRSSWAKVKAGTISDPVLHPGDVIQLTSLAKRSLPSRRSVL
ncbi:MAG: hypothetical protein JWM68_4231 [Verrucomicrobiales bacterium]|nr:hypothetical protein [Verrucomicrobiales bacterium]